MYLYSLLFCFYFGIFCASNKRCRRGRWVPSLQKESPAPNPPRGEGGERGLVCSSICSRCLHSHRACRGIVMLACCGRGTIKDRGVVIPATEPELPETPQRNSEPTPQQTGGPSGRAQRKDSRASSKDLYPSLTAAANGRPDAFTVTLRRGNGQTLPLSVYPEQTVDQLHQQISFALGPGLPACTIRLIFKSQSDKHVRIADCGLVWGRRRRYTAAGRGASSPPSHTRSLFSCAPAHVFRPSPLHGARPTMFDDLPRLCGVDAIGVCPQVKDGAAPKMNDSDSPGPLAVAPTSSQRAVEGSALGSHRCPDEFPTPI